MKFRGWVLLLLVLALLAGACDVTDWSISLGSYGGAPPAPPFAGDACCADTPDAPLKIVCTWTVALPGGSGSSCMDMIDRCYPSINQAKIAAYSSALANLPVGASVTDGPSCSHAGCITGRRKLDMVEGAPLCGDLFAGTDAGACRPIGAPCVFDNVCCSGICDPDNLVCEACRSGWETCWTDQECCSGNCVLNGCGLPLDGGA